MILWKSSQGALSVAKRDVVRKRKGEEIFSPSPAVPRRVRSSAHASFFRFSYEKLFLEVAPPLRKKFRKIFCEFMVF